MNKVEKFDQETVRKLALEILEIQLSSSVATRFTLEQLEAVVATYQSKRIILIEEKENEPNGYQVERINTELSGIRLEITKINKAIALVNESKSKKNTRSAKVIENNKFSLVEFNKEQQTDEDILLIKNIKTCKTIPDLSETFSMEQLQNAKNIFATQKKLTLEDSVKETPTLTTHEKNLQLQLINNEVSRINKAILLVDKKTLKFTKKEEASSPENIEKSYRYLYAMVKLAKKELGESKFNEMKQKVFDSLNE